MVAQLKSCCCGASLRTGTIIIAVLGLLGGVAILIQGAIYVGVPDEPDMSKNTTMSMNTSADNSTTEQGTAGKVGIIIVVVIYGFLEIVTDILLLVGVTKNSAKLVYPWIVINVILCILGLIFFFGIGILITVGGLLAVGIGYICWTLLGTAIHIYCILVVNSFHTTLKAGPLPRA